MRYLIRIFTDESQEQDGEFVYDDEIYRTDEASVPLQAVLLEARVNTAETLIELWQHLLVNYEGYTYCVKNIGKNVIITGGVFDPSDIDYINEYFEQEEKLCLSISE